MTDTPWTPGPWVWVRKTSGFYRGLEGGDGSSVFCADEYAGSCWLELENEANARLIAAAPDLYAALELLVKRFGPLAEDGKIARAALARAKGATT